jgi:hypothetical protein
MTMTKSERAELRSVVRGQMKVLRSEIDQRKTELLADIDTQVAAHYAAADRAWEGFQHVVGEAAREADRKINDALHEAGYEIKTGFETSYVRVQGLAKPTRARHEMKVKAERQLAAQVHAAHLRLAREEADLLRTLSVGALESDEARAFLARIPTVGELVSAARLVELEAAAAQSDDPRAEW